MPWPPSRAAISSACGTASFIVWLFAQSPQILTNYQRGSVDGLSLVFLGQWMGGDVTNLLGCILTDQLTFQKLTAAWFCLVDVVLMAQYIVYSRRDAKRRRQQQQQQQQQHHHTRHSHSRSRSVLVRTSSTMDGVYSALFSPSHHAHHRHESRRRHSTKRIKQRTRTNTLDMSASVDLAPASSPVLRPFVRSQSEQRVTLDGTTTSHHHRDRGRHHNGDHASRSRSALTEEARKVALLLAGQMRHAKGSSHHGHDGEQDDYFVRRHPHHGDTSRQSSRRNSRPSSRNSSRSNSRNTSAASSPRLGYTSSRQHSNSSAHRHLARLDPMPRIDSVNEAPRATIDAALIHRRLDDEDAANSAITIRPEASPPTSRRRKAAWGILGALGLGSLAGIGSSAADTLSTLFSGTSPAPPPDAPAPSLLLLGRLLSWLCTLLYLTSRLPQIYENHTRRSVAGLSILLFISAFVGNALYAVSILTSPLMNAEDDGGDYFRECMPFLLGSAGTLVFDAVILGQWMAWGGKEGEINRNAGTSSDEETGSISSHSHHHQRGRPPRKHYGAVPTNSSGVNEQVQVDTVAAS